MKLKRIFTGISLVAVCLLNLFVPTASAQEAELEAFKKGLNVFVDFSNGMIDSLPQTEKNHLAITGKVDKLFKAFVLHKESSTYEKWVPVKGDERKKFIRLDDRISVYLTSFTVGSKNYVVYSYVSRDKKNYLMKDFEKNELVFDGKSKHWFVDNIFAIDKDYILLVEEDGERGSSRVATVLSTKKIPWITTKSFEGKAFGQVPGSYNNKQYVKRREVFKLNCDFSVTLSAPGDVNRIHFDPATKTLSCKQYTDTRNFKLVAAKWENQVFVIDDYDVSEHMPGNGM